MCGANINLSKKLADKVRVNIVSPGNVFFGGGEWERKYKEDPDKINNLINETVPMKRFGTPEDIANVVLFLASEKASFMTGSNIVVEAREDISLKAGRNISLSASQTVNLRGNKVQASGQTGNIMKAIGHVTGGVGSFVQRAFSKTQVGGDRLI